MQWPIKSIWFTFVSFHVIYTNIAIRPLDPVYMPPINSKDSQMCFHDTAAGRARLEPPADKFIFGFSLDWAIDHPQALRDRLGGPAVPLIK